MRHIVLSFWFVFISYFTMISCGTKEYVSSTKGSNITKNAENNINSILKKRGNFICSQIINNPSFNYKENFAVDFRKAVSYEDFIYELKQIYNVAGTCVSNKSYFVESSTTKAIFELNTKKGIVLF